jgi:hypothetical protein
MTKRQVFYSFHFDNDFFRVQQIRNIGALEDNEPVSAGEWEKIKTGGDKAIEKWIDDTMKKRSCVVVLIGTETAQRPWVKYEIKKAWAERKGLLGIHINHLKDPKKGTCIKGANPFAPFTFKDKQGNIKTIPCKTPSLIDAYNDIKNNLEGWVEEAIRNNS